MNLLTQMGALPSAGAPEGERLLILTSRLHFNQSSTGQLLGATMSNYLGHLFEGDYIIPYP